MTVVATVVGLFPLFAGISVQPPVAAFEKQPFSLSFQMTNESLLPALSVEYSCVIDDAKFFNSNSTFTNVHVRTTTKRRTLWGRETMTARCENAFNLPDYLESARYSLRIRYRHIPWPWKRSAVFKFEAIVDQRTHRIAKWVPE